MKNSLCHCLSIGARDKPHPQAQRAVSASLSSSAARASRAPATELLNASRAPFGGGKRSERPPNGWRISRRTAETADETGKGTFKDETGNNKTRDSAVGPCPVPCPGRTGPGRTRTGLHALVSGPSPLFMCLPSLRSGITGPGQLAILPEPASVKKDQQ